MDTVTPDSDKSTTPSRGPRVSFIWDYSPRTNLRVLLAGAGFFVMGSIPMALGVNAALSKFRVSSNVASALIDVAMFAFVIGAFMSCMRVAELLMPRQNRSSKPKRIDRLDWLLDRREGPNRFPHRRIERLHYRMHAKSRALNSPISALAPGQVIILNCPGYDTARVTHRSLLAFEPIHFRRSECRLKWLASTIVDHPETETDARLRQQLGQRQAWRAFFFQGLPSGAFISGLIGSSLANHFAWMELAWIFSIVAIAGFVFLFFGRQHILVPDGLVRLQNGLYFRKSRLELFTPQNASLVVYSDGGAYIASQGKSFFLQSDARMATALLIAWLSSARTPTMSELQTLLAPEASTMARPAESGDVGGAA